MFLVCLGVLVGCRSVPPKVSPIIQPKAYQTVVDADKAWKAAPKSTEAWLNLADALARDNRFPETKDILTRTKKQFPDDARPYIGLSRIYEQADLLDLAIDEAQAGCWMENHSVLARIRTGELYTGMDWQKRALSTLNRLEKECAPSDRLAWVLAATEARFQSSDYRGVEKALLSLGGDVLQYERLAVLSVDVDIKQNMLVRARATCDACIVRFPQNPVFQQRLLQILNRSGKYTEARDFGKAALARFPENVELTYELALAEQGLENYAQAIKWLEQVVLTRPGYDRSDLILSSLYTRTGEKTKASRYLTSFRQMEAKHARGTKAILAVANQPDSSVAHLNAGDFHIATGRIPRAVVEYREAFRLEPNSDTRVRLKNALIRMQRNEPPMPLGDAK